MPATSSLCAVRRPRLGHGSTVRRTYRTEPTMNRTVVLVVHNPTVVVEEMMRGLLMEATDTGCSAALAPLTSSTRLDYGCER